MMERSPIILISCRRLSGDIEAQGVKLSYLQSLSEFGAQPVLLPVGSSRESIDRLMKIADGILLPGGEDVSPEKGGALWSGTTSTSCHLERDNLELEMVDAARKFRIPILGICRGIQVLNVAFGGKLIGDIAENDPHALSHMGEIPSCYEAEEVRNHFSKRHHSVVVQHDSWLCDIYGRSEFEVNSFHHQAVDPNGIGTGLRSCAWAPDGTVEAIEGVDRGHFVVGVQWHPEMLVYFGDLVWKTFFQRFVDVCRKS